MIETPIPYLKFYDIVEFSFSEKSSMGSNFAIIFNIQEGAKGQIRCFVLGPKIQDEDLDLVAESLNILIGQQLSTDSVLMDAKIKISTPQIQKSHYSEATGLLYQLVVHEKEYKCLINYELELLH